MPTPLLRSLLTACSLCCAAVLLTGCASRAKVKPGTPVKRHGDEIVIAGQYFRTGAPVVLWTDPGGYDAYRVERRFGPIEQASWTATTQAAATQPNRMQLDAPNRYGTRTKVLTTQEAEQVRGGGWPLSLVQEKVDQFVLHYDVAGTSERCFRVLHDMRGLSVHFMLDIDGTIYQTIDVKDACWHATKANHRSVGIEIANLGAYASGEVDPFKAWYAKDDDGRTRITLPKSLGTGVRTKDFVGRPARDELVVGEVQGSPRRQYDFTPQQYDSLIKLTAALCTVLPKIECDYPRDEQGRLIPHALTDAQWEPFQGVIGHYHVQKNKSDPGPAFQWDYVIDNARKLMGKPRKSAGGTIRGTPAASPATAPTTQPTARATVTGEGTR